MNNMSEPAAEYDMQEVADVALEMFGPSDDAVIEMRDKAGNLLKLCVQEKWFDVDLSDDEHVAVLRWLGVPEFEAKDEV